MKNILIPILVLIFLVGAGIAEALIVNNIFEDFIAETDKLIELAKNEELTQEKFDAYDSMWYDVREKCEFFLPHSDVYEPASFRNKRIRRKQRLRVMSCSA